MIEIREIKPVENEFLREMLYEAIYLADENKKPPKAIVFAPPLSKYVDNFGREGDFAFVLAADGKPVGAVWSRLFTENEKGYGFVDEKTPELSIAIVESFRNRGYGQILIEKLLRALEANGFRKVSLSVDKRNRAFNLYLKIGFEPAAAQGAAVTMVKILNKFE